MNVKENTPAQADTVSPESNDGEVASMAYLIWEERGRTDGHDLEDWLVAEMLLGLGSKQNAQQMERMRCGNDRSGFLRDINEAMLDTALQLFELREDFSKVGQKRRQKVCAFFDSMAEDIEDARGQIEEGSYPHRDCESLLSHSRQLVPIIGGIIGAQRAFSLAHQLHDVWQVEDLFGPDNPMPAHEKPHVLHVLEESSGLLRATAEFIRASS